MERKITQELANLEAEAKAYVMEWIHGMVSATSTLGSELIELKHEPGQFVVVVLWNGKPVAAASAGTAGSVGEEGVAEAVAKLGESVYGEASRFGVIQADGSVKPIRGN